MAFSLADLKDAVQEFGRNKFIEQANMEAPLVDMKMADGGIKSQAKVFELLKLPASVGKVVVKSGGYASTGWKADGGTRNASSDIDHKIGTYGYRIITSSAFFPTGITKVASGGEGIDLFASAIESAGRDGGKSLDRALLNSALDAPIGTVAVGATSFTVNDASGYAIGDQVDFYSGSTLVQSSRVSAVSIPTTGASTITLSAATTAALTGTTPYLRGAGESSQRMLSLRDVNDSGTILYSGLASGDQPAGALDSATISYSNSKLKGLISRIKKQSGGRPTHIIADPTNVQRMYEAQINGQQLVQNGKLDIYGAAMMFDGLPVIEDSNQSATVIDVVDSKSIKVHEFWEFAPEADGAGQGSWGKESLVLSQSRIGHELYLNGGYQLRVERRNTSGRMSAIAS